MELGAHAGGGGGGAGAIRGDLGYGREGRIKGPGRRRSRREEVGIGEQILERLRNLARDEKRGSVKAVDENKVSSNVLLERAAIKETRDWEEESDDNEAGDKAKSGDKKAKGAKEKLVDV
jgi:hypothetical protein